jgi:RNA polymerase sigma-70 factor (ECF subfamily)
VDFETINRDYAAAILRTVSLYAREPTERDDLLQEISLALWRALPSFRGDCSLKTFVFRIAHYQGMRFALRRRAATAPLLEEELVSPEDGPEQALIDKRGRKALQDAVCALPLAYRQVASLSLEGLSNQEIAAVLGIDKGNVAVRLHRAKQSLEQRLKAWR